jgi:YggT family protein
MALHYRQCRSSLSDRMFLQIITFLLQIAAGLLVGLCLLRLYMQYHRVPLSARSGNPIGPLIFALTDWLVLPLRRVIPSLGRWDIASLVAALLIELAQYLILWLIAGGHSSPAFTVLLAVFGVMRLAVSGLSVLVIVYAVMSWVQPHSPMMGLLGRLVSPLLQPIRRAVPLVGGVDLSPLILLVLLQVGGIVLESAFAGIGL